MQNWLFSEPSPASAIEAQMDDPLDQIGQLYYAAMESATFDARSKLKETKRALKSLRAEMSDAEKAGNYKLAAEKARECASLCDDALKAIDQLPKSMPKAILLDVAITVILILSAALAWKAIDTLKNNAVDRARAAAASEKAAKEAERQLSKDLEEEKKRHESKLQETFRMEKEGHAKNVRAVNEIKQINDDLKKMEINHERMKETRDRIQQLVQEKYLKSVESDPETAKLLADYRAIEYQLDEAIRKTKGLRMAAERGQATYEEWHQMAKNVDAAVLRQIETEKKLRAVLDKAHFIYADPSLTETGRRAQSIIDQSFMRHAEKRVDEHLAHARNNSALSQMQQAKSKMSEEKNLHKQKVGQHIAHSIKTRKWLESEYMANPPESVVARTAELSKGSRTRATAGKALYGLASLIPGGVAVSSVAKALSEAVKAGKVDSTDVNPFIAAYKNDLKSTKKRYEDIAAEYDQMVSSAATESKVSEGFIPALEGEFVLELDDIMESYGDIIMECAILDLADGFRPGFPDINDGTNSAMETDYSWSFM